MTMEYNGEERRKEPRYCAGHFGFSTSLARIEERLISVDKRINGSIDDITKHIEHGAKWRLTICGLVLGFAIFIFNVVVTQAKTNKLVEINTEKWKVLESSQIKK